MSATTTHLYHGTPRSNLDAILSEGIEAPSYWGDLEEAMRYAGEDGVVFRVPVGEFDPDMLAFNDLLAASLVDSGEDVPTEGDWRTSLTELGSVRYDAFLTVDASMVVGEETTPTLR